MPKKDKSSLEERFFSKFIKKGDNECWIWQGTVHVDGYGLIGINGKMILAHRVSWSILKGDIPKDSNVLHNCDKRLCVNPNHLKLVLKKNGSGNFKNRITKLTQEKANYIRSEYSKGEITQAKLAILYGVSQKEISDVINFKIWKD